MKLVISPEESAKLDAGSGLPVETLMQRAGTAVAVAAGRMGARYGARVAVLCGTGNNGGDGYVAAAELLRRGASPVVHALGDPSPGSAAAWAADRARTGRVPVRRLGEPVVSDLVIDALFGVGFHGTLPSATVPWTHLDVPVLSIDIPSGVDASTGAASEAFTADRTVTFHALKPGHVLGSGPDHCGTVEIADIGLHGGDPVMRLCEDEDAPRPPRARHAHKWSAGSVAVVGGSSGLSGAPVLAARAALSGGAGAVTLVVPADVQAIVAGASPQLMTHGVGEARLHEADIDEIIDITDRYDVMVLGPGLGSGTGGLVEQILLRRVGGIVLDADGLTALRGTDALASRQGPTVLTPHAGEFERLTGSPAGWEAAAELPDELGVVVLLKGNPTFVTGRQRWVVTSGGPELATIGTGDVLSGALAALWARGLEPEEAARSAAHWHGRAGGSIAASGLTADKLATEIGTWVR